MSHKLENFGKFGDAGTNAPLARSGVNDSDAELAHRAIAGDLRAFEVIMRLNNQRLFRLATAIVGDANEAEDVLQESYVRAFYSLSKFAGRGTLGAWLAQIVRNEAIDRLRARNSQRKFESLETDLGESEESFLEAQPASSEDVAIDPHAATENSEMKRVLEDAIAGLPDAFRTVFVLREVEGLSIEETAEYLAIPAATVRTRDHRARNLLRQRLGERIDRTLPGTFEFLGTRCDNIVLRVLARLQH